MDHAHPRHQGDAIWVNQSLATADHLAYVDGNGKAIIKVDNTSNVIYNNKRNSVRSTRALEGPSIHPSSKVRVTTANTFPVGSLFLLDALHLPYGCSVWPGETILFFPSPIGVYLILFSFLDNGYGGLL